AVEAGEDVVIASQGQPQVRLVPCNKSRGLRHPGALRDRFGKATEQVDAAFSDGTEAEVRAALQGLIG
ncbi:MAG: hypothetical protein RLZZ124_1641, partial [Cyanobacteriota bacterium]